MLVFSFNQLNIEARKLVSAANNKMYTNFKINFKGKYFLAIFPLLSKFYKYLVIIHANNSVSKISDWVFFSLFYKFVQIRRNLFSFILTFYSCLEAIEI